MGIRATAFVVWCPSSDHYGPLKYHHRVDQRKELYFFTPIIGQELEPERERMVRNIMSFLSLTNRHTVYMAQGHKVIINKKATKHPGY